MVELKSVQITEEKLLFNLLQKYLYELSLYYGDDVDAEGNIPYNYFKDYFWDETRKALLIVKENVVVGFVMLNQHSNIGGNPDHVIAEFCVLPKYRRLHIAKEVFELLMKTYPGKWEVKCSNQNIPAVKLWNKVTKPYSPTTYELEDGEIVFAFDAEMR